MAVWLRKPTRVSGDQRLQTPRHLEPDHGLLVTVVDPLRGLPGHPSPLPTALGHRRPNQLLMYADKGVDSTTVLCLPLAVAAPVGGCFVARRRVDTIPIAAVAADSEFGA